MRNLQEQVILFVCNRGDTVQHHGGLRSRELGQAPMLQVFLTPRQALSSHPHQQKVVNTHFPELKVCNNPFYQSGQFSGTFTVTVCAH